MLAIGHRPFRSAVTDGCRQPEQYRRGEGFMKIDLSGHRAIISGSTAGIGFAVATGLARAGAAVVINGRSEAGTFDAVRRLSRLVPTASIDGVDADLGSAACVDYFASKAGNADILVNNLGIYEAKPFLDISDALWRQIFDVNVMSGVRLCRHYFPKMLASNWGRIVFMSSESALNIPAEMIHYGMTKTAQLAVARGLAELTAGTGVTVNSVLPGPTRSEGVDKFVAQLARERGLSEAEVERSFFAELRPSSLLKRFATVEEVANMVVYIVSEQAAATNGAALRVDGGVVRSIV
jgi:NAD(P)-dependent dehydrogenase (short-subunit alcohol dehydrogenase family)